MVVGDEIKSSRIKHVDMFYSRSSERNGYSAHSLLVEKVRQGNDLRLKV